MIMKKARIVFFGTPEFASYILSKLIEEKYEIVGMNVSEVIELLGDGDWTEDIHERNIRYYRVGSSFPGAKFYVIKNKGLMTLKS